MKSFKFGYKTGYYLGIILMYVLYGIGIASVVLDLIHFNLPLLSLTYLFVLSIWRKLMQIQVGLNLNVAINEKIQTLNKLIASEEAMNRSFNNKFGGPN